MTISRTADFVPGVRWLLALSILLIAAGCARPDSLYFVPIDNFPDRLMMKLVEHYERELNLKIHVLPRMPLDPRVVDERRRQLIAEELIDLMQERYPDVAADRGAVMIGLTGRDMYIRAKNWRFAFASRTWGRFAVVSSARMDPMNLGEMVDDTLMETRLRKMLTKQIALLYFRMAQSSDPNSVLYNRIMGLEELDRVGEDLQPGS